MKRSEMLALMYGKFTKEHTIKKASVHDALDKLLDYMIEQGMQPPPYEIWLDVSPLNILGSGLKIQKKVNEWEPEDEEK